MQVSSSEFASLVQTDHQHVARVIVNYNGDFVDDTYGLGKHVQLLAGDVTIDRASDTRRTASLSLLDVSGQGKIIMDPIAGAEVLIQRGIILASTGQPEWISLGKFTAQDMNISRDGASVVLDLQLTDRSDRIRQNPLRTVYQVASGTNQMTALSAFYTNRASGFTPVVSTMATAKTSPDTFYNETDDPWGIIQDMAQAAAGEAYHDAEGICQVWPIPDPDLLPVVLQFAKDDVLITPISRSVSRRDVYNGVIVRGEAAWLLFQISGEAWDDDPTSPTYRLGSFGEKPKVIGNAQASTNGECATIAAAEFLKIKGVQEDISFNVLPDPRIDAGDVIQIVDSDLGVSGRYMLETVKLPLVEGPMSGTVKRRR